MRQHTEGMVVRVLLEIYFSFQQWKYFENSFSIDKVIAMSLVYFFGTQFTSLCYKCKSNKNNKHLQIKFIKFFKAIIEQENTLWNCIKGPNYDSIIFSERIISVCVTSLMTSPLLQHQWTVLKESFKNKSTQTAQTLPRPLQCRRLVSDNILWKMPIS